MERSEVEEPVLRALDMLYARDSFLLEDDAAEWSIAHRLAIYLGEALPGKNASDADSGKAREYTEQPGAERHFQYRYGLAVTLHGPQLTWFEDGRRISQQRYGPAGRRFAPPTGHGER